MKTSAPFDQDLLPLTQELNSSIETTKLSRRSLLQGLSAFLGVALIPSLEACSSSALPDDLQGRSEEMRAILTHWAPPPSVISLGREIIAVNGDMPQRIESMLKSLVKRVRLEETNPKELAKALKSLHLESAKSGSWVEVKGWRLSAVEAAAYALSSFDLS